MKGFKNRTDAGQQLASALTKYKDQNNTIVLGLPRGGVPVAYEVATALHLPMTVFLVRKLGVPGQEELAMGAIAEGDVCIFNKMLIAQLGVTEAEIQAVLNREKPELKRRVQLYRQGQPLPELKDKTIILVDDGIATGATIKAATKALITLQPKEIIIAVPVASQESVLELSTLADDIICLMTPEYFYGVGNWYQVFDQTTDDEVLALLGAV